MKTIYFVRHGESEANIQNVYSGWNDVALTGNGRAEAEMAAGNLDGKGIKKIIASDLSRARDTAEIIADHLGIDRKKISFDQRLREVDVGRLTGAPDQGLELYLENATGANEMCVENLEGVVDRLRSLYEEVIRDKAETVLLVGHTGSGNVLRLIAQGSEDIAAGLRGQSNMANGEVVELYAGGSGE
jgi:broad specificity phosphatase PhoE